MILINKASFYLLLCLFRLPINWNAKAVYLTADIRQSSVIPPVVFLKFLQPQLLFLVFFFPLLVFFFFPFPALLPFFLYFLPFFLVFFFFPFPFLAFFPLLVFLPGLASLTTLMVKGCLSKWRQRRICYLTPVFSFSEPEVEATKIRSKTPKSKIVAFILPQFYWSFICLLTLYISLAINTCVKVCILKPEQMH